MYGTLLLSAVLALSRLFPPAGSEQPTYRDLSPDDVARLDRQRDVVGRAAKQHYGTPTLTRTKSDLSVLQRLIDDKVFSSQQTYELQCLGVAFGDVLASEFPLRWMMVADEFGTDPTLRFKNTNFQVNALTMISKRIENPPVRPYRYDAPCSRKLVARGAEFEIAKPGKLRQRWPLS